MCGGVCGLPFDVETCSYALCLLMHHAGLEALHHSATHRDAMVVGRGAAFASDAVPLHGLQQCVWSDGGVQRLRQTRCRAAGLVAVERCHITVQWDGVVTDECRG